MRNILLILLLFVSGVASGQIIKTAGIPYTATTPAHTPSASGSLWAIDTGQLDLYVYYSGAWNLAGERIQTISGCSAPMYTPGKGQSLFVVNACDSLYYYRASAWRHLNKVFSVDTSGYNRVLSFSNDTLCIGDDNDTLCVYIPATVYYAGTGITISGDTIYNAGDLSATNEIQAVDTFEIVSDSLRVSLSSDGVPYSAVDLSPYLENTDTSGYNLSASVSNDSLFITDGNGTINAKFNGWDTNAANDITGAGTQSQLAYFSGAQSVASKSNFAVDTVNNHLLLSSAWRFGVIGSGTTASLFAVTDPTFTGWRTSTGTRNAAFGPEALNSVTRGSNNVAIGADALRRDTSGGNNIAIGYLSLANLLSGTTNTAIGDGALQTGTTFLGNVAIGSNAGRVATSNNNVFIGRESGYDITSGNQHVMIGRYAGGGITTGSNNTIIGYEAGRGASSGISSSVFLGYNAGRLATQSNSLYIENSNDTLPLIGGNFSTNRVGINTDIDDLARALHVTGEVRITDLVTDNPTRLVGADADGDLNRIILGSNLSLSNDTLNASAGSGNTDLSFSGASSPVTLASSTGNDVRFVAGSNISLASGGDSLVITATGGGGIDSTSARNTGATGEGVYSYEASNVLNFKKLIAGSNITLTGADSSITIAATGGSSPTVITPSTITSDQDNYSPTNWATATIVRISGDSMIRAITGFASAGIADGHEKKLVNVGSYPVYTPGEHPDSQDSNRVSVGYDYIIYPKAACWLLYDNTANRWVITSEQSNIDNPRTITRSTTPISNTAADYHDFGFTAINSGTLSSVAASGYTPAGLSLNLSATSGSGVDAYYSKSFNQNVQIITAHIQCKALITLSALSDATDNFCVEVRLTNGIGTADSANNSVGFRYNYTINGGNWTLFSRSNTGSESTVDCGVAVSAFNTYDMNVVIDKSKSEVRGYINGQYVGRVTSNLPNNNNVGASVVIARTGAIGTNARSLRLHQLVQKSIHP